jgi:biotin carboxyl carrier protein
MTQPLDAAPSALAVVSAPEGGVLELASPTILTTEGEIVLAGQELGRVGESALRAPVSGWLIDTLARSGQRVVAGQAIARVRPLSGMPAPDPAQGDHG